MKKQHLQEVRPEDFNIAALRRAAREGRLYIVPAVECEINIEEHVLSYVAAIEPYAAPQYRACIGEVWRSIVRHPDLSPLLASRKEAFCKYAVTAIAMNLNNRGVYTFATATELCRQLEGGEKRSIYYRNAMKYAPGMKGSKALCGIIHEALEKKIQEK